MGVGYRYLTFSQCWLLLRAASVTEDVHAVFMASLLHA